MRSNKLLLAAAASALLAGTGLATAKDESRANHSAPAHVQTHAQSHVQTHPQTHVNRGAPVHMGQTEPEQRGKSDRLDMQKRQGPVGTEGSPARAQDQNRNNPNLGAQRQDNQSRGAALSTEQRTKIRQTVLSEHNAPRISRNDVGVDIRVGGMIPRDRIHFRPVPLPESIVEIEPQWQGFLYFLVGDEVVVVDPSSYEIVAVLPA
jgi:hypothetical protein